MTNEQLLTIIALASPVAFIATAIASWMQPGFVKKMGIGSTLISILMAGAGSFLAIHHGLLETSLLGVHDFGLSLRFDSLSMLMFSMIALLSFIVMRFSLNYLDGDARQGVFIGRLAATIATVQLLVLSGNLGVLFVSWVLTSMSLHRLLVFYKERPGALIAARKKFIVARAGDACLLAAVILLYFQFDTGNLEGIFQGIKQSRTSGLPIRGVFNTAIEETAFFIGSCFFAFSENFHQNKYPCLLE